VRCSFRTPCHPLGHAAIAREPTSDPAVGDPRQQGRVRFHPPFETGDFELFVRTVHGVVIEAEAHEQAERERRERERQFLESAAVRRAERRSVAAPKSQVLAGLVALVSLVVCLGLGVEALRTGNISLVHNWLLWPTVVYLGSATLWSLMKERGRV
jgi:hypothetical protein